MTEKKPNILFVGFGASRRAAQDIIGGLVESNRNGARTLTLRRAGEVSDQLGPNLPTAPPFDFTGFKPLSATVVSVTEPQRGALAVWADRT